ncbi:MAG: chalcone isomerase family protein [Cytophaga sp.]|nr:chalcone isomerase family protein [Undibacterium sp.]
MNRRFALLGVVSALFFSSPVFAETTVAGVKFDDTAQVGNQTLKLNGAGVRYKVIFKVYVAAMYLPELKSTTAEVLALPGAKRVTLVIMRDLSSDDLGLRFMEGLKKNLEVSERAKLIGGMLTFGQMFSLIPGMKKGDILTIDWVPGTGVVSQYNGKKLGETIPDPNFYNAVLKIWLGNHPADEPLKHKMLNDKSEEVTR